MTVALMKRNQRGGLTASHWRRRHSEIALVVGCMVAGYAAHVAVRTVRPALAPLDVWPVGGLDESPVALTASTGAPL